MQHSTIRAAVFLIFGLLFASVAHAACPAGSQCEPFSTFTNSVAGATLPQSTDRVPYVQGPLTKYIPPRLPLLTSPSLYVATTGSDAGNNCSIQASPCLTLQQACTQAMFNYDMRGQSVFIQVADGTYNAGCRIAGAAVGSQNVAVAAITIIGDVANPDAVEIHDTTQAPGAFITTNGAVLVLDGMRIDSDNGSATFPGLGSEIAISNVDFGNTHFGQMHAETGGESAIVGNYSISGSAPAHIENVTGGQARISEIPITITVNGSITYSDAFVSLAENSFAYFVPKLGGTFGVVFAGSGTISGKRYDIASNSVLETEQGNASSFPPGTLAGRAVGSGIYSPTGLVPTRLLTPTSNATIFVNSSVGSDTGNACTDGNFPCQHLDYACSQAPNHDLGNNASLVVEIAAGTYSTGCYLSGPSTGSQFSFPSSPGTEALPVIIEGPFGGGATVTDASGAQAAFVFGSGITVSVINLTIGSTAGDGILAQYGAHVFQQNNTFASCAGAHMDAKDGGTFTMVGSYAISGGATHHLLGERHGDFVFASGITVTLTGTPSWSAGGVVLDDLSVASIPSSGVTFSGPAVGTRFSVISNSVLDTGNPGGTPSTFLPGSVNGTTASGGQAL
jgi:hypothetical protein